MARQLLHPEDPCRSNEILTLLNDAVEIPGVCTLCMDSTVSKIEQSDALRHEEALRNIAILDVMELQYRPHNSN